MATIPQSSAALPVDDAILSFMPMIYVAWADGQLNADELDALERQVQGFDWLDGAQRQKLAQWLNPQAPPSAQDLQDILGRIRSASPGLDDSARRSLVELGLKMAALDPDEDAAAQARRALDEVESALGFLGQEAARDILAPETAQEPAPPLEPEANFDVAAMAAFLDRTYPETRQKVRQMLTGAEFQTNTDELSKEAYREEVLKWCQRVADEGFGALAYPGVVVEGEDLGAFVAAFETLSGFDLSLVVKFGVQFGLFGGSIYFLGTEEQRQKYLHDTASLKLPGCFAMTERGHGSNVRGLLTEAVYESETDSFVVHSPGESAGKEYIGNAAAHGRMATVFAQLKVGEDVHGVHAFLVPIRDEDGNAMPGVRIEDCGPKMGLNGVDNGRLWFDRVRIPRGNLLSRYGQVDENGQYHSPIASPGRRFFTMLGTLVGGRVSVACSGAAAARKALTIAIRYGARRRQFGPTGKPEVAIMDYQTHQRRLLVPLARAYALDFALKEMVGHWNTQDKDEDKSREVEAMAAALKATATWFATETIQTCRECCGGAGYISDSRFASLKADTDVFTTFEGDNTVLLQLVARSLLTAWKQQFMEDRVFAVFRMLARQTTTAIAELNPYVTRQTDTAHLRDPEFHLAAMRYREESLLNSLARRLKKRIDDGMDSFDAFNECQTHAVGLGQAYADRVVVEAFARGVEACQDERLRATLIELRDLHALSVIEADSAWFMEAGYIEPTKARAIRRQVTALCKAIRPQATHLVDAFSMPEAFMGSLGAPL